MSPFGGLDLCALQARLLHAARLRQPRRRDVHGLHAADLPAAPDARARLRRVRRQARGGRVARRTHDRQDPSVRYRTHWYRSSGYDPVWWGTTTRTDNDTDYRWYDDPANDDNDDNGGGFDDS